MTESNTEEKKPKADADDLIGKTIAGRYEILSLIGKGGIGIVYKAKHLLMDRIVALKMLRQDVVHDERTIKRFQQEAKAASSLRHPNIVSIFDFGVTENNEAFLVMDFLAGIDFDTYIINQNPGDIKKMLPLFIQICDALCNAHKNGVIHRDLKPANIVILDANTSTPVVKLLDFGLAKLQPKSGREVLSLTKPGEIFGSPYYMSPEQCQGQPLDERADIYSMGCLMYEALSGQPPFLGNNVTEMAELHMKGKLHSIASVINQPNFCPGLETIISTALEKTLSKRYQSMTELWDALIALQNSLDLDSPSIVISQAPTKSPKSGRRIILLAVLIFAGLSLFAYFSQSKKSDTREDLISKEQQWQALDQKARDLFEDGNSEEAETTYLTAIRLAEAGGPYMEASLANSLAGLGEIYYREKKFDLAETVLERAVDSIENTKGAKSADLAPVLLKLGKLYIVMGRLPEAEALHKRALGIVEECFGAQDQQMADTLKQYAELKHKQGHRDAASQMKTQAEKIEFLNNNKTH